MELPKTKEEAREYRYGVWAGKPDGYPYDNDRCAYETYSNYTRMFYQCTRKPGHGPESLYCKQHSKMVGGNP